jgi:hypothetical protein
VGTVALAGASPRARWSRCFPSRAVADCPYPASHWLAVRSSCRVLRGSLLTPVVGRWSAPPLSRGPAPDLPSAWLACLGVRPIPALLPITVLGMCAPGEDTCSPPPAAIPVPLLAQCSASDSTLGVGLHKLPVPVRMPHRTYLGRSCLQIPCV